MEKALLLAMDVFREVPYTSKWFFACILTQVSLERVDYNDIFKMRQKSKTTVTKIFHLNMQDNVPSFLEV